MLSSVAFTTYSNGELLGEIIICPEARTYHTLIVTVSVVVSSCTGCTSSGCKPGSGERDAPRVDEGLRVDVLRCGYILS